MKRVGRGMRTLLAACGALAIIGLVVFAVVGISQDTSTTQQFDDERISQVEQDRNLAQAKRKYRDYVAQREGPRTDQAQADRPLLRQVEEANAVVFHCGINNSDYGVPNYSSCADDPELPGQVEVEVQSDGYVISASSGGATFTLSKGSDLVEERSCDQPGVGACAPDGSWLI